MGKKIALVVIAILLIANLAVVAMLMNRNSEPAPAATPTPAATAAPTPEPTAAPTPTPEPTAEPTATPEPTEAPTPTPKLEIDPNAGALITPTPAPQEPGIAIPGWGSITLPAGVTEAQVALKNPEDNADWYYLTFELRLPTVDEETGEEGYEVVFSTGLIPPGQYCNKVTLTRALEAGEYAAVVRVQPYRMADLSPTNNADMETVLIVK